MEPGRIPISDDEVDTLSCPLWPSSEPDVGGCRSPGSAEIQPEYIPISEDAVDTLSCQRWPSSEPIALSCRFRTDRNPNPPQSRKLLPAAPRQPMSLSPATSPSDVSRSQLPATEGTIGTSPSRYPPWAPPRRFPRRRRPLRPLQDRQPTYLEHRQNNLDSDLAPEKRSKITSTTSSTPSTAAATSSTPSAAAATSSCGAAAAERKRKFTSGPFDQYNSSSCAKREKVTSECSSQEKAFEEKVDSDSSSFSSPLREPRAPLVPIWTSRTGVVYDGLSNDREALDMYHNAYQKYLIKEARHAELPTLKSSRSNASIKEGYSLKQKEIFLNAAKSILSLSANLDGVEISRCSGVVLGLDATKKSAIILTSAWLICTNMPIDEWSDKKYAPEAKVTVHLLDGTSVNAKLLYFSKHYDVIFYEILEDSQFQILSVEPGFNYDQDLFLLARETNMGLICKKVQIKFVDPCQNQHNHYMFVNDSIPKCGTGGALVDMNGKIAGMLFNTLPLTAFIPSSLIIRCLGLLRQFGRVVRPQLGLKLATVGFLDIAHIELLCRRYGVTSGLIVGEVSAGCFAERVGIRRGDVILSCQGVSILSVAQLEEILLDIGEKHFGKGNDQSSEVNVELCVLHVRKGRQRIISLTLELSDGIEVFHSG